MRKYSVTWFCYVNAAALWVDFARAAAPRGRTVVRARIQQIHVLVNFCTKNEGCPPATRIRLKRFRYIAEGDEMGVSVATPSECQGAELLLFCDLLLPLLSLLAIRVGSKNVLHLEEREEGYWIPAHSQYFRYDNVASKSQEDSAVHASRQSLTLYQPMTAKAVMSSHKP